MLYYALYFQYSIILSSIANFSILYLSKAYHSRVEYSIKVCIYYPILYYIYYYIKKITGVDLWRKQKFLGGFLVLTYEKARVGQNNRVEVFFLVGEQKNAYFWVCVDFEKKSKHAFKRPASRLRWKKMFWHICGKTKKRVKVKKRRPQLNSQFQANIQHSAAGSVDDEVERQHLDWAWVCGWVRVDSKQDFSAVGLHERRL